MKNLMLGVLIGATISVGTYAFAAVQGASGLQLVDSVKTPGSNYVDKLWDVDTNTICFLAHNVTQGALSISCLKNN